MRGPALALILVLLAAAIAISVVIAQPQTAPSASPSPTVGVTATPTALPTTATPTSTAGATRYVSPAGYSLDLPPGWRRSDLVSQTGPLPNGDPEIVLLDVFTRRTPSDEQSAYDRTHVGFGPIYFFTAFVHVDRNSDGLEPMPFAEREKGKLGMDPVSVEPITFQGRPAAKTTWRYPPSGTRTSYAIYFRDERGRIWIVGYYLAPDDAGGDVPAGATEADVRGIPESFRLAP